MSTSLDVLGISSPPLKNGIRNWWNKITAAHPRAANFKAMKIPVVEKGVFGIALKDSLKYAYACISYVDDATKTYHYGAVPIVVAKCGSFVKNEGLSTQGIFRKPGNSGRLRYLQTMFDSPECYGSQVTWSGCTVHDAATLLQRYLNYLPEPVVSYDLYYSFMHANEKQYAKESDKIAAMQQLISQLPPENQYLLLYLLDLLHVFAANHDKTLMDAYCLALVLAPGMLSHPDERMKPEKCKEAAKVVQYLIENQQNFSMPSNSLQPISEVSNDETNNVNEEELPYENPDPDTVVDTVVRPAAAARWSSNSSSSLSSKRPSTMYDTPKRCSGTDFVTPPPSKRPSLRSQARLRRAKTVPSKRHRYGEYDQPQVVHINRNASQGANVVNGWRERQKA